MGNNSSSCGNCSKLETINISELYIADIPDVTYQIKVGHRKNM